MADGDKRKMEAYLKRHDLERIIASYFNRKHCLLLGSGTTSLYVIFKALDLHTHSKVLYPDLSCETAVNAAIYAGLSPIFSDINLKTFNMDTEKVAILCENDIGAIVPTHIFGNILDVTALSERLAGRGGFVIEDSAQSFGGTISGSKTGSMGDASIVSFGDGKTVDCGGGGAVLTDSGEFYRRCLDVAKNLHSDPSTRAALKNEFLMEIFKLKKMVKDRDCFIRERDELKRKYKDAYIFEIADERVEKIAVAFNDIDAVTKVLRAKATAIEDVLADSAGATMPAKSGEPVYWRYSFLVNGDRDAVFDALIAQNISASRFFSPLHREYNLPDEDYPNTVNLFSRVINVRLDFDLSQASAVARALESTIEKYAA